MAKKDISFLQVKSTAEKIFNSGEKPTVKRLYSLLSDIGTRQQITECLKRWRGERQQDGLPIVPTKADQEESSERTEELERSLSLVRATLESTADGILMIDKGGKLVDWNKKFLEITRLPKEVLEKDDEMAGIKYFLAQIDKPEELLGMMMDLQMNPEMEGEVGEVRYKNGRVLERYSQPHRVGNEIVGRVWSFRDVTEQRKAEEALMLQKRAIESSTQGVVIAVNNDDLTVEYVNPAFTKITGYDAKQIIGDKLTVLFKEDLSQPEIRRLFIGIKENREEHLVLRSYRCNGDLFWNEMHVAPVPDNEGKIQHVVAIVDDITERKAMEEQLIHQATHDTLTALPNRVLMQDRGQQALLYARRDRSLAAVLFIDVDHFKLINDSLGHKMGDNLLCAVAKRITNSLRATDTVARLGGDEFVIILSPIFNMEDVLRIAQKLIQEIRKPFHVQERELMITASIGVACYPQDGHDMDILIRNADTAMYHAKDNGRDNFQFFTEDMNRLVSHRLMMQNCLRKALERNEFTLNYQPVISLQTGLIQGVESLIRWESPELGKVSPAEFIPMVEETGMIIPIGEWVLETACRQGLKWHQQGFKIDVAVNLSGRQLMQDDIVDTIRDILAKTKFPGDHLVLELTESILMENTEETIVKLNHFRDMGVRLAIDDFGTGYSSLSYLKRLPVNKLKIDQTFVKDIGVDKNDEAIVLAIIAMCKNLSLGVVAEGTQTKKQMDFLRQYQCDEVQGFYFSKPIDHDSCTRLLRENHGSLGGQVHKGE